MSIAGAHADYSRSDYHFARQQSLKLRALEWEGREKPIQSYGDRALAGLLFGVVAGAYVLHVVGFF